MDLRPGDVVYGQRPDNRFEIIRPIGSGSFGVVYEVHDEQGKSFALKTVLTGWVGSAGLRALMNEGHLATEIQHQNALRVFFFHDGKQYPELLPFMLMEYAEGGTLEDLLDERRAHQQHFEAREISAALLQLASGMKAINEKPVHRDIKPNNILIADGALKIADFGLSKIVGAATRTSTFKGINHMKYCAPEAWQLSNNAPAMDMYSMGIVFYEVATLSHPYHVEPTGDVVEAWKTAHLSQVAADPRALNPDVNLGHAQLISRMMSKRPKDRYSSWDEVIQRLQSPWEPADSVRDVSSLVERAAQRHQEREQGRLDAEERERQRRQHERIVEWSFNEIISAARETTEAFNRASEFAELHLTQTGGLSFSVHPGRQSRKRVQVSIAPVNGVELNNDAIRAWGHAKAPSGRGFNLLLVATERDDLYGRWLTLHVKYSALTRRRERLEPFPFEMDELPKEIKLVHAVHIYNSDIAVFEPSCLNPLIEELL